MAKANDNNHGKKCNYEDDFRSECECSHESPEEQEEMGSLGSEDAPLPKVVSIDEKELEALRRDAAEHKDKYLRNLAESENQRKRLQKERQDLTQYAIQNVIADFLHPIDHMENALKYKDQMSPEVKGWAMGFEMILNQFKDVLSDQGVTPIISVGTPFDPHLHEAIEVVETDEYPPGTVVEEIIKGYKMGDKVVRPARVKVSKAIIES